MMVTVDDIISSGYWRKYYNETIKDYEDKALYTKDDLSRIPRFWHPEDKQAQNEIRKSLLQENEEMKKGAVEKVRGIMQTVVDAFNERGMTIEEIREAYKS